MLEILTWITVTIVVLVGILLYFGRLKKTGRWGWGLPKFALPEISGASDGLSGYILPVLLFIALLLVMWLTNESLGWWSFFTRDGKTFAALVITYLIFASAFMQEKKKAPFYQKIMVFAMIIAVAIALTGSPFNPQKGYGLGSTQYIQPSDSDDTTVKHEALKSIENTTPQSITVRPGVFERVSFPPEASLIENFDIQCPQGCLVAVEHSLTQEEPQVCSDGIFNGEKCWVEHSVPGVHRDEYRVREVFTVPAGDGSFNLPHDLRAFILWVSSSNDAPTTVTVNITWSR